MAERYGYLKFTGKYAELKHLGYTFQKLFAGNYMSWSKGGVFIFKKGSDVTHGNIDLFKLFKFLETGPEITIRKGNLSFYKFYSDPDSGEYEYYPRTKENSDKFSANMKEWGEWDKDSGDPAPEYMSTEFVSKKLMDQMTELSVRGWIELAYRGED